MSGLFGGFFRPTPGQKKKDAINAEQVEHRIIKAAFFSAKQAESGYNDLVDGYKHHDFQKTWNALLKIQFNLDTINLDAHKISDYAKRLGNDFRQIAQFVSPAEAARLRLATNDEKEVIGYCIYLNTQINELLTRIEQLKNNERTRHHPDNRYSTQVVENELTAVGRGLQELSSNLKHLPLAEQKAEFEGNASVTRR
jgi:hypothetical protein